MPTYESTIDLDGHEVEVSVEYNAVKASGDGWNEPHEPAHIEIEKVTTIDGRVIALTRKQTSSMEEEVSEWIGGEYDPCPPDTYDERYDDHYGGD